MPIRQEHHPEAPTPATRPTPSNLSEKVARDLLECEQHLVHVAPVPLFTRLVRLDNAMPIRVKMLRSMRVLRVIAATNLPANHAQTQVNPLVTHLDTLQTLIRRRRRHIINHLQMRAITIKITH